jgi:hypothetical protein
MPSMGTTQIFGTTSTGLMQTAPNIFATAQQADTRLGGTGRICSVNGVASIVIGNPIFSSSAITGIGEQVKAQDPMSGEVDPLIMAQFEELKSLSNPDRNIVQLIMIV